MFDYHIHSVFSSDCQSRLKDIVAFACAEDLQEICITDHVDFDEYYKESGIFDMDEFIAAIDEIKRSGCKVGVKCGIELGLKDIYTAELIEKHIAGKRLDFIIGSVHCTDEGDPYFTDYFEDMSREKAYLMYIRGLAKRCVTTTNYDVLGHFNYPAKNAPYVDRAMHVTDATEYFEYIFDFLVSNNIGIEINTSVYKTREEALWGLDVLEKYVSCGGEFVTIGSDAHLPQNVGWRNKEAVEMSKQAGIKYIATFTDRVPTFHKI